MPSVADAHGDPLTSRSTPYPSVSVLITAQDQERYVEAAIASALAQRYPPDLLDVVVVDRGSRDRSVPVISALSERHPGRVTLLLEPSLDEVSALNHGRAACRGQLVAPLDARDLWLPEKVHHQVSRLRKEPGLSGVFCDIWRVDEDLRPVGQPRYRAEDPDLESRLSAPEPSQFAQILCRNLATRSSVMVDSAAFSTIPLEVTCVDWWLMLAAARRSRIVFLAEPLVLRRDDRGSLSERSPHGAVATVRDRLRAIRTFGGDRLSASDLRHIWREGAEAGALAAVHATGGPFVELMERQPANASAARASRTLAEEAAEEGDYLGAAQQLLVSLAWDPYSAGTRERLEEMAGLAEQVQALPDPLAGARRIVLLADAETLADDPARLTAYADAVVGAEDCTLAIDASRLSPDVAAAQLESTVAAAGLQDRDDVHMIAFVGELNPGRRFTVLSRTAAVYEAAHGESLVAHLVRRGNTPAFSAETIGQIRAQLLAPAGEA